MLFDKENDSYTHPKYMQIWQYSSFKHATDDSHIWLKNWATCIEKTFLCW